MILVVSHSYVSVPDFTRELVVSELPADRIRHNKRDLLLTEAPTLSRRSHPPALQTDAEETRAKRPHLERTEPSDHVGKELHQPRMLFGGVGPAAQGQGLQDAQVEATRRERSASATGGRRSLPPSVASGFLSALTPITSSHTRPSHLGCLEAIFPSLLLLERGVEHSASHVCDPWKKTSPACLSLDHPQP